jgi:hypothetical protein
LSVGASLAPDQSCPEFTPTLQITLIGSKKKLQSENISEIVI